MAFRDCICLILWIGRKVEVGRGNLGVYVLFGRCSEGFKFWGRLDSGGFLMGMVIVLELNTTWHKEWVEISRSKKKEKPKSLLECSMTGFELRLGLQEATRKIEIAN